MEVTLSTGLLEYTNDDGTTGFINLSNAVDAQVVNGITITSGAQDTGPMMVDPPTLTPYWIVKVRMNDWRWLDLYMGQITNQATWDNTLEGANTAISDIGAALP